jgi:hypothetical protein
MIAIEAQGARKKRRSWNTRQPKRQTFQFAPSWHGEDASSLTRVPDGHTSYRESPVRPFYVESDVLVPLFHSLISGGMAGVIAGAASASLGLWEPLPAAGLSFAGITAWVWAARMRLLPSLVVVYEEMTGKDVDKDGKAGRGTPTIWTKIGGALGTRDDEQSDQRQGQPRIEMRGEPAPSTWDELPPEKQVRDVAHFVKIVSERQARGDGVGQKQFRELNVILPSGFPITDDWHSDVVGKLRQVGIVVAKGTAWELAPGVGAGDVWEKLTPVYW